ncbi:hypothetical protein CC78DRAFT_521863 [Lojkania enalia]|uniref:Glycoside hydrolase subgroup catalytic core n=1 Tax=Lojkania enalia TaxID=147567 RepID=A0A9P4N746_9PLEO|nr:hypothetical protein CC78DRAFT_521863 [Didymosphaeria enalia]
MSSSCLYYCFIPAVMLPLVVLLQLLLGQSVSSEPPFNNPPGVDIWCGKAYHATNSSFDPGGRLTEPTPPGDNRLRLDLRVYPRKSLYLLSEKSVEFIVDAPLSLTHGTPYENWTVNATGRVPFTTLYVDLRDEGHNVIAQAKIPVNSTGNSITIALSDISISQNGKDHQIYALGNSKNAIWSYHEYANLVILPDRNDRGSVARVDNLYGAIEVKSSLTNGQWKPIFPYSFYTSWDWISSTINNSSATKNLTTFRQLGYNIIHPVPPGGSDPFNHTVFEEFLKICDSLELYVMYDMRHTYQNHTSITQQLSLLQHHPSLLLYYTADEPDGWCDALNATRLSYQHIQSLDPYHPISLVLNCENFYFRNYVDGAADIVLEDTYPIAVNTSFSSVYHTVCNATYGDCGCDNCHAGDPSYPAYVFNRFLDIIHRTDALYLYQEWLGWRAKKPVWGVPQAFYDAGSFWQRFPSKLEEAVMGILRMNHGAKGIVAWIYPTSRDIEDVTSSLAQIVTSEKVTKFTLGAELMRPSVVGGDGLVDVSAWLLNEEALVSVVHMAYEATRNNTEIRFPGKNVLLGETLWPELDSVQTTYGRGIALSKLEELEVLIFKVRLEDSQMGLHGAEVRVENPVADY